MKYISTRGKAEALGFDDVLLSGLARDGGLYVPDAWPKVSQAEIAEFSGLPYAELALRVIRPFVGGTIDDGALAGIIDEAYSRFDSPDVAPVKDIGNNEYLMEMFHGPTLAFKDMAMQFLGPVFDHVLKTRGETVTIIGATSGDTGSAAIEACRGRDAIEIFMLHPHGRVSDVQRRQMTTVSDANVHNIAIEGTFDDCQDLVKAMFNDEPLRDRLRFSAVNSINWARIMAQTVYYFFAASKVHALGETKGPVSFAVPTGNFGNVFAGYGASRMGLDVDQFVVGSNSNDILTRFFESGSMALGEVHPTISPSMDIQISSNFERLLFDLLDRDGDRVRAVMEEFRETGKFSVANKALETAQALFYGACFDDGATKQTIREVYEATGELLDPHSAVGLAAARAQRRDSRVPMIALATAHPAKFPDAVQDATGVRPTLPDRMAGLMEGEERCDVLANDFEAVRAYVSDHARSGQ
ncbi:MAG: threonine synthase [Rhodospirillales bacterium]|nr:threonine synthase [Alphaproteobacteria bacterium]MBL6947682.1 threonine synthase [Rhodospirillales bacterium]